MTFTWKWGYGRTTNSPKALAIWDIIVGTALVVIFGGILLGIQIFKFNSIKTTGIVIENVKEKGSDGDLYYSTRYSYIDFMGNEHIKTSSGSKSKKFETGDRINVFYLKKNTDKSIYDSIMNTIYLFAFVVGIIILVIGLFSYHKHKDEEIVWSEEGWHQC